MDLNFPEGVHYLASESYQAGSYWGINTGGIIFTILALIGLVIIIGSLIRSGPDEFFIILGLWIFIMFGVFALIAYCANPIYNTQYLVTIEQYVPYSEIQKEYKIISSKDNIVVLRPLTPVPWEEDKENLN